MDGLPSAGRRTLKPFAARGQGARCFNMSDINIILAGFMGTGKTTVGRILAIRLKKTFIDMDGIIEERAGKAISRIFAEEGEPYFRQLERNLVKELSGGRNQVIAAGGGVVLNPDNINDFSRAGRVICLMASETEIMRRVSASSDRPLLENGDKLGRIKKLLEQRRHLYESIRDRVNTTGLRPQEVAEVIMLMLKEEGG